MRILLMSWLVTASLAAQSATVSTTADSGPGSLRAAIVAANASGAPSFTITVAASATTGPIVLASLLPSIARSDVTITAAVGAGRLVVDARPPTASSGVGFDFGGSRIQFLAPCTLLVAQAHGVVVHGTQNRLADLEATGGLGGVGVVALAGANDLVIGRLVLDHFLDGVQLLNCTNARIADDGVSVATVTSGGGIGVNIAGGSGHAIGSFVGSLLEVGVMAIGSPSLVVGRATNPRGLVAACRQQGIVLNGCSGASVAHLDLFGNGTNAAVPGLQVLGGSGHTIVDVRSEANSGGGLAFGGGASNFRIGPTVSTRGPGGPGNSGLALRAVSAATVVDCQFGPDHAFGVVVQPEMAGTPANVTVCRSTIVGNRTTGVLLQRSIDVLLSASIVAGNLGDGVQASGASLATAPRGVVIAGCVLGPNAGSGVLAQNVDGIKVGPGDRVADNVNAGLQFFGCANVVVDGAPSIDRNRNTGIWLVDCNDAVVVRSTLRENRGNAIQTIRCNGAVLGPDNVIQDTFGTGVLVENSNACRVIGTRVTASSAYGVHVLTSFGSIGTATHVLQSCLIAAHPGLGLLLANSPPVLCQLSTIAGNLRGVSSGGSPLTIDSCIVHSNLLEDLQQGATAMTVRNTFFAIPAPTGGAANTNVNPQFVAPAAGDFRIQPTSPAVGYANTQTVVVAPGAVDAFAGPRVVGALDAGAYEVGPHPAVARLSLSSPTMAHGGGGLAFHARHPASAAGTIAILLMEIGPASGSFPVFGGFVPLASTPALFVAANDSQSVGTVAIVAPDGTVDGALLWAGRILPSVQNQIISLCSVAFDLTPTLHSVTNVATFTIL